MNTGNQASEIARAEQEKPTGKPLLSTHVLDTSRGVAASGVSVKLYKCLNETWVHLKESVTDTNGRCTDLVKPEDFEAARYKLEFKVGKYFEDLKINSMYPAIEVIFDVRDGKDHHHIPLLLNPFGYTTYRGT